MQVRPQWETRESTPQWETRESTQVPRTELGGQREGQVVHRWIYYVNSSFTVTSSTVYVRLSSSRYQHQALRASEYVEDNHEVEGAARLVSAAGGELAKVMD